MSQRIKDEYLQELDRFLAYAVKEGCLDEEAVFSMSLEDKEAYFGRSEVLANSQE